MSEDNPSRFTVLAFTLISICFSVIIGFGQLFGYTNPEPSSILALSIVPFGVALGSYAIARFAQRKEVTFTYDAEKPFPEPEGSKFCSDCGKLFELRQRQEGFDPQTGRARLSYQLGCPDGDPNKNTDAYNAYMATVRSMGMGAFPFTRQRYRWPNCGELTARPLAPVGHLGHEPGGTSTTCPKCIEEMLAQNIITLPDAKKLISAIGKVE